MAVDASLAKQLIDEMTTDLQPTGRIGKVRRYLKGDHDLPYIPRGSKQEFITLAKRSVTNWLPLFSDTFVRGLFVDGYRTARTADNAKPWEYWQANGLDSRQSIIHRGALEYGVSYNLVLPSNTDAPLIRPLPPTRAAAFYAEDDDDYPQVGIILRGTSPSGDALYDIVDSTALHPYVLSDGELRAQGNPQEHGFPGITPMVRFRDRLDGEATGIIAPLITLQERVNEIVFYTLIAMQYAAFRQRWATGLVIPHDEETGDPIEPFKAAIDRLWISDSPDTKFGDFAQTDTTNHIQAYVSTVRTMGAIGQVSPNLLTGDLINLSADALEQMRNATDQALGEYRTILGEPWEMTFRLAAFAANDNAAATDTASEVRWRDTIPRSLEQVVKALSQMAEDLGVPAQELWEKIPGVTDQDVTRWKAAREADDGQRQMLEDFLRQGQPLELTGSRQEASGGAVDDG